MSGFEEVTPYTQEELDRQAIWSDEFNQWWENEGQYHRAGGNDYCRTFAWWAWLNREQLQQARIDELDAELTHWKQNYWNQAERLAEYDSIFMQNSDDLEVLCFKKEKEIERLKAQLKALRGEG